MKFGCSMEKLKIWITLSANDPPDLSYSFNQYAHLEMIKVHPELFKLIEIGIDHSLAEDSYQILPSGPSCSFGGSASKMLKFRMRKKLKTFSLLIKEYYSWQLSKKCRFKFANMAIDLVFSKRLCSRPAYSICWNQGSAGSWLRETSWHSALILPSQWPMEHRPQEPESKRNILL